MAKRIIKHEGVLDMGGKKLPCYVLGDGTRVLSSRGMQEVLKMVDEVEDGKQTPGTRLQRYLTQKSLMPFIFKGKDPDHFNPIICYKGASKINGYEATRLVDFCDGMIEARNTIELSTRQEIIAKECEIIIRSVAKVGIIALIDEATGYQYERERDELQKILKAYISDELLAWQKRFPDVFYKELFRLNGWDYTVSGIKKRPSVIGTWTNVLVYEQLPKGVLEELKKKTPKSARLHQSLTLDVGEPNLSAQINQIIAIFRISDTMKEMWFNFKKLMNRKIGVVEIPFEFDEKGHTIETINEKH